jgi:hypothetical protein
MAERTPKVSWPFLGLGDQDGCDVGWMALTGPLRGAPERAMFDALRPNHRMLGFTSYLTFPAEITEGSIEDYGDLCEAWCHCFRDPDRFLPVRLPRVLISESDFMDPHQISPERLGPPVRHSSGAFDLVYVCGPDQWHAECKNLALARECIPRLCDALGVRVLVVGREGAEDFPPRDGIVLSPRVRRDVLLSTIAHARALFVPNVVDASPRLVAEAMCMDVPLVMHRGILGGWKYINPFTGVFFEGVHDVVEATRRCLERGLRPRRWFRANYGPYHAGRRLREFLLGLDAGVSSAMVVLPLERTPRGAP